VLCLIIFTTSQLLWQFVHVFNINGCHAEIPQPLWKSRLFIFFDIVELILSASVKNFNAHPLVSPSKNRLHSLEEAWRPFNSSGDHTKVSLNLLAETINGFQQLDCEEQH
jgi:hypothetical protein